ncbi:MAG TPA: DUF4087 domain-containing protein [Allosphingosinicella sp.]|jgi:hypothetical protein|nr:DUF4087 domain-containing protein [Allosphingosinicella sp.]
MRVPLGGALAAALLAASACSPGSEPKREEARAEAPAGTAPANAAAPVSAPAPKRPAPASGPQGKRRCGWLSNPTPANWWLTDSEGQWILATQGADQAPGMEDMPDMSTAGWVETNGHYGYGCACMTISADGDGRVTRISDASPRPLKQCRADRKLPAPE